MKMHCPHCGVKGSVDDSYVGKKVRCPKCREIFHCQVDEQAVAGVVGLEPMPPLPPEPPAPPPIDEDVAAEPLTEATESLEEIAGEEPASLEDDSVDLESQVAVESEEVAGAGSLKEEPAGAALEAEPSFEAEEEAREAEEIEALLAGEAEAETVEEIPAEPAEEPVAVEVAGQEPFIGSGEVTAESDEGPEIPRPEDESRPPSPDLEAMELPLAMEPFAAGDTQQAPVAKETPAVSDRFAQGAKPRMDFTMGEALNEAWRYTKGAKGSIWAAVGMTYLIMLILGIGLMYLQQQIGLDPESATGIWAEIGIQSLASAMSTLFTAGVFYIGVRRAAEKSYSWKMIFDGFSMAVKLIVASILMTLLIVSGVVLLVLPGIYLAVGYTMTLPLMLDRRLDPWQAMEVSRKAIHKVWWKVFGLFFVMGLIYMVSAIPFGIGLIWTVPMSVVLVGVVYRYLFGVQAK